MSSQNLTHRKKFERIFKILSEKSNKMRSVHFSTQSTFPHHPFYHKNIFFTGHPLPIPAPNKQIFKSISQQNSNIHYQTTPIKKVDKWKSFCFLWFFMSKKGIRKMSTWKHVNTLFRPEMISPHKS